jgi:hypothetical protein
MNAHLQAQLDAAKKAVQKKMANVTPYALGHAFLWGVVEVKYKNGNSKRVRMCLGSVCAMDLEECVALAESVPGVSDVYYNLD